MVTRFPIDDLRTLVARALHDGGYSPAESKRIRAVPDTRTIRYYTTLGLIDRPAEMRGRTALYEPHHVMQLVAIKRLQAANQTLSDVQTRLVGITTKQLSKLADLPDDFWESAQRYLARKATNPAEVAESPAVSTSTLPTTDQDADEIREFWDQPAALPHSAPPSPPIDPSIPLAMRVSSGTSDWLSRCVSFEPMPGLRILIEGTPDLDSVDIAELRNATQPLLNELLRQGLLKATSLPPEVTP
jgi:DNA-binding transcriptional MerR regulator